MTGDRGVVKVKLEQLVDGKILFGNQLIYGTPSEDFIHTISKNPSDDGIVNVLYRVRRQEKVANLIESSRDTFYPEQDVGVYEGEDSDCYTQEKFALTYAGLWREL